MATMLMNPVTGSVDTLEGWKADFEAIAEEDRAALWGGESFEDAGLVEVVKDENGDWVEADA